MSKIENKKSGISRRDFLKISAAAGVGATMIDWVATKPNPAVAAVVANNYDKITTCPYCSVGCNMKVGLDAGGNVVDIIGDPDCPINKGKLCSKGAAAIQLVNNERRVGVPNSIHAASIPNGTTAEGPMKKVGNGAWQPMTWDTAIDEIATAMVAGRGAVPTSGGKVNGSAKGVAFLGCSHATNEENWLYRKLIANFGTNNTEHQARI